MTSQVGYKKQIQYKYCQISQVISGISGNQKMKFGQMSIISEKSFLKNHALNVMENLILDPFLKKTEIEHISG